MFCRFVLWNTLFGHDFSENFFIIQFPFLLKRAPVVVVVVVAIRRITDGVHSGPVKLLSLFKT